MSTYAEARYRNAEKTEIVVLIDGVRCTVPADVTNSAYGDIVREKIPIAAYDPPVTVDRAALKEEARALLADGKIAEAMKKLGLL